MHPTQALLVESGVCARFSVSGEKLAKFFKLKERPKFERVYNLAPTEVAPVIGQSKDGDRVVREMRWGLIPSWAKDKSVAHKMINARSESLSERPAFRDAFQRRRCLVPAEGFFEWIHIEDPGMQLELFGEVSNKVKKQPYYITPRGENLFALAGLWDSWKAPEGEVIDTFTIITTEPNELIKPMHNRMPAILPPDLFDLWLDRSFSEPEPLQELLQPYPAELMEATLVSTAVNDPKYKAEDCVQPLV